KRTPPLGDFRSHKIVVGGGSDSTRANTFAPWSAMWCFVTGKAIDDAPKRDSQHRLTREEALEAYTFKGSWFTNEESHRGRIAPGHFADLCVPTSDPFTCDIDEYLAMRSDLTIMGGDVTHSGGVFAA